MTARTWILAALLMVAANHSTHAEVFVESSETVINQQQGVGGGQYAWYTMTLEDRTVLNVKLQIAGGIDNALKVWLLDLPNFQLFQANQPFQHWPAASPVVTQKGSFTFTVPKTSVYYLVLDNRQSLTRRNTALHVDRNTGRPSEYSEAKRTAYGAHYAAMKGLFVFDDFDIHIQSCGTVNAFSNPNIVICTELIDETRNKGVPAAETFVFYHEVSHSLLNLWRFPLYDNEDAADEFATVMLMLLGEQNAALQAAQWWATQSSAQEVKVKLLVDDRHSLSGQRARNIINWLNKKEELTSRWLRVMVPNMTTDALTKLAAAADKSSPATPDEAKIYEAIKAELSKREQHATNR